MSRFSLFSFARYRFTHEKRRIKRFCFGVPGTPCKSGPCRPERQSAESFDISNFRLIRLFRLICECVCLVYVRFCACMCGVVYGACHLERVLNVCTLVQRCNVYIDNNQYMTTYTCKYNIVIYNNNNNNNSNIILIIARRYQRYVRKSIFLQTGTSGCLVP